MNRRSFLQLGLLTAGSLAIPSTLLYKPFPTFDFTHKPGFLNAVDIWEGVKYYANPDLTYFYEDKVTQFPYHEVGAKINNGVTNSILEYNVPDGPDYYRNIRIVQHLGVRTRDVQKGCKRLAKVLEDVQRRYGLWRYLGKPMAIKLADDSFMLVAYIVTGTDVNLVKANYKYAFLEGGIAPFIDSDEDTLFSIQKKNEKAIIKMGWEIVAGL